MAEGDLPISPPAPLPPKEEGNPDALSVALREVREVRAWGNDFPPWGTNYNSSKQEPNRPEPEMLPAHPFQAYVRRYTASNLEEADVWVNQGTIMAGESVAACVPIDFIEDSHAVEAGSWCWIEVDFAADGTPSSCQLKVDTATWADYPLLYGNVSPTGNTWYHPIFRMGAPVTAKSTAASLPDAPFPDRGFFPQLKASLHIHQLTHTHLKTEQRCVDGQLIWTLVPGAGGVQP